MMEMAIVLGACGVLIVVAYEYTAMIKREWGENSRNFF